MGKQCIINLLWGGRYKLLAKTWQTDKSKRKYLEKYFNMGFIQYLAENPDLEVTHYGGFGIPYSMDFDTKNAKRAIRDYPAGYDDTFKENPVMRIIDKNGDRKISIAEIEDAYRLAYGKTDNLTRLCLTTSYRGLNRSMKEDITDLFTKSPDRILRGSELERYVNGK